jgi:hypothetical protein
MGSPSVRGAVTMYSPKEKEIANKFLDWFETLNQEDAEVFMAMMGRIFRGIR